jgi:hypothetical protein
LCFVKEKDDNGKCGLRAGSKGARGLHSATAKLVHGIVGDHSIIRKRATWYGAYNELCTLNSKISKFAKL